MRDFYGFYSNGKYKVGLSGTVWVYDMEDRLLGRFTETPYSYLGAFVPGTDRFVCHTNECHLVVYDLAEMRMLKKIRTSRCDVAESEGLAFSPDGKRLYCIQADWTNERKRRLLVYDTENFEVLKEYFALQERLLPCEIEIEDDGTCYLSAGLRDAETGVITEWAVGLFRDGALVEPRAYDEDWKTVLAYFNWKRSGYTRKAFQLMPGKRTLSPETLRGKTLKGLYETGHL